jgi:hypothetical protein
MSPAMLAALEASILYPAIFVSIGFASTTAYVWSGVGPITWNGNTYSGVGDLGQIAVIEEASDVNAKGIALTLSGVDATMVADAIQENQLGLPVTVWLALYMGPGGSIIADPLICWQGRTDQPETVVTGEDAVITLRCESRLMDMDIAPDRRYTLEDSQLVTPGELAFQFVTAISEVAINWGSAATNTPNV